MRGIAVIGVAIGLALAIAACARNELPVAGPADSARAAQKWPGTTADDLGEGRRLYLKRCSGCHLTIAPSAVEAAAWPGHLEEMRERANLLPDEMRLIERYLVTMAEASE